MTAVRELTSPTGRPRRRRVGRRRRQGYGVTTAGVYSGVPAWWSRERWRSECFADLHGEQVRELRREVGRRGPVSVQACWALAHALSAAADAGTGRNALPGNAALTTERQTLLHLDLTDPAALARLEAATGYRHTTLQKAARVLAARGWIQLIRAGKNWLRVDERKELWAAGTSARCRRNVWACTIPAHLRCGTPDAPAAAAAPVPARHQHPDHHRDRQDLARENEPVDNSAAVNPTDIAGCDLPTTRRVSGPSPVNTNKILKPERASRTGPAGRTPTEDGSGKRTYRADWRTVRLAKDLRARIYWLTNVPLQAIMPPLDRFARAGWTATDVQRHLDALLAARNWEIPTGRTTTSRTGRVHRYPLRSPWGYLAMLLRGLEPTDLAAQREHERVTRTAQLEYEQLRRTGPECPHGEPAGDHPSPTSGVLACPFCRRAAH